MFWLRNMKIKFWLRTLNESPDQVPHLTQDTTWESDKITIRHHKQATRGQPFNGR